MRHSEQRILTTHAGSLPRPKALSDLHARRFAGTQVDVAALTQAEAAATRDIVAKQIAAGVDVINNGEMGRESFFTYVQHRMTGFAGESSRPIMRDLTNYPSFLEYLVRTAISAESVSLLRAPKAVAAVTYRTADAVQAECALLRRTLEAHAGQYVEAFVTAPSPGIVAAAMQNEHYATLADYVDAVAIALRHEYKTIIDAGFVLQIDAPDLAMERHTLFADKPLADFLDFMRVVIAAINRALDGLPRESVRLHVCWGNYEGPHDQDVALEEIWPEIDKATVGAIVLSMANPRHAHEYHCFEQLQLPKGASLIAGVIDTTTNYIEHPKAVADRLRLIATALGDPGRLMAGTDCGFETSAGFAMVAEDVVWQKLAALSAGASIASRELFGS